MQPDERDQLLGGLDDKGFRDLLVKLSAPLIGKVPRQQLERLSADAVRSVYLRQEQDAARNAFLAQVPDHTLNEAIVKLSRTFQVSLDSKVLRRLNDQALVKLLDGFTGADLKELLDRIGSQRLGALSADIREQIAKGEARDIKDLLALNTSKPEPDPVKSTTEPPANVPGGVLQEKSPEGLIVSYIDLPAVPKAPDAKEHNLGRIDKIRQLKIHGLGFVKYVGTEGQWPRVERSKSSSASQLEVILTSKDAGKPPSPLCTFRAEADGLTFKWDCFRRTRTESSFRPAAVQRYGD